MRSQLIDIFGTYRARVNVVYVEVPNELRAAQNANRTHMVPEAAVSRMMEKWEVPSLWEAHEVVYVTH